MACSDSDMILKIFRPVRRLSQLIAMQSRISCRHLFLFALIFFATIAFSLPSSAKENYLRQWPNGVPAPSLKLNDSDGREWTIQSLRGKVIVLNFWASWCAPCIDELPFLNELATRAAANGKLVVLGVNFKESAATIRRFSNEHQLNYPLLMDQSGEQFRKWASGVLPTTVLIDRNGRPRWRIVGELDRADTSLRQALEKMLEEEGQDNDGRIQASAK